MRSRFDDNGNPDIKAVVANYRDALRKRMRWVAPGAIIIALLLIATTSTYTIEPGWVGVVRTFGQQTSETKPGLHFLIPFVQRINKVNLARIRRAEIGFRSTKAGPKRVDSEALMLTGDENIVEAQMIVQFKVRDPSKYLFRLKDPEKTLHIAAEVALRGVVGQTVITSNLERSHGAAAGAREDVAVPTEPQKAEDPAASKDAPDADKKVAAGKAPPKAQPAKAEVKPKAKPAMDILTTGREQAQRATAKMLQELLDLYESGIEVTDVKLQAVDAPDEVKDAFHDVVRAREEREQTINKALGYREDKLPRARGQAQKILRAAEAYKKERVLRAEGEAARYVSVLAEYRKAKAVTRLRLHLEVMERILARVDKKIFIDKDVVRRALPLLSLDGSGLGAVRGGR
jgi:membrane protease subunit HflK